MIGSALLPVAGWALILAGILRARPRSGRREACLLASTICGVAVAAMTESLSLFHRLSPAGITLLWVWFVLAAALAYALAAQKHPAPRLALPKPGAADTALIACLAVMAALLGLTALMSPPHEYDSLTYHLPRVMHWLQNGDVRHYPTNILRQLYMAPWAEFAILNLQALTGTDRLANCVQWLSMAGSWLGVSLIAERFGADRRQQLFAAVLAATLPMGIGESTTTQNDYAAAFWLTCSVHFALRLADERGDRLYASAAGAALGLAFLTKATIYLYALPFLIWGAAHIIRCEKRLALKPLALIAAVTLALNAGHYARNYSLFGSLLDVEDKDIPAYSDGSFSGLVSNIARNATLHMATTSEYANQRLEKAVVAAHGLLGIHADSPRTTLVNLGRFHVTHIAGENSTGNPLHLILICAAAAFLFRRRRTAPVILKIYAAALLCSALLFCLVLKWTPFNSRYHLPLFILAAPWAAALLPRGKIALAISGILLAFTCPWLFKHPMHPLLGEKNIFATPREDLYLSPPEPSPFFEAAAEGLAKTRCADLGLRFDWNDKEYLLWVLLNGRKGRIRIDHVDVKNISARLSSRPPFADFRPCAVLNSVTIGGTTAWRF